MSGSAIERARHLLAAGRNEDALEELGRALADDPDDAVAHGLRALALLDLERLDEALESAERAVGADPEHPFGHEVRGWVLLRAGRGKDALASAQEALALPLNVGLPAVAAVRLVLVAACRELLDVRATIPELARLGPRGRWLSGPV